MPAGAASSACYPDRKQCPDLAGRFVHHLEHHQEKLMPFTLPPLAHVGIVVADLERAAADYERHWGVTTEQVQDLALDDARLHGKQAPTSARYGLISTGASQI